MSGSVARADTRNDSFVTAAPKFSALLWKSCELLCAALEAPVASWHLCGWCTISALGSTQWARWKHPVKSRMDGQKSRQHEPWELKKGSFSE